MPADPRAELVAAAGLLYGRGWMAGTAGNLSARLGDGSFWITASGVPKGRLGEEDFLRVAPGGEVLERGRPHGRPSDETAIHAALYALFPAARACLHVHTVESNLVARLAAGGAVELPPLEMLKGLGVGEEEPRVPLAVFPNHLESARIAGDVRERFEREPPAVPGLLVRDHGVTAWGADVQRALDHLELLDYLFRYAVAARRAGIE